MHVKYMRLQISFNASVMTQYMHVCMYQVQFEPAVHNWYILVKMFYKLIALSFSL